MVHVEWWPKHWAGLHHQRLARPNTLRKGLENNFICVCSLVLAAFSLDQKNEMNLDVNQQLLIKSENGETKHWGPHRVRRGSCFETPS